MGEGDEVLDNYLDLRLPHHARQEMMRFHHGIDDEGPDNFDAPANATKEIQTAHGKVKKLMKKGTIEASQAAFKQLAEISNRCDETGVTDPAFADVFKDFALVAGRLGDAS